MAALLMSNGSGDLLVGHQDDSAQLINAILEHPLNSTAKRGKGNSHKYYSFTHSENAKTQALNSL